MVNSVRIVEKAIGKVTYGGTKSEEECKKFRKSLFGFNGSQMFQL